MLDYDFESSRIANRVRRSVPKVLNIKVLSLYKIPIALISEINFRAVLQRFTSRCEHLSMSPTLS